MELCSHGDFPCLHEHRFFRALPNAVLSFAAIQCGHGNEKRNLSAFDVADIPCLLFDDAGAHAHAGLWRYDHCVLRRLLLGCLPAYLSICPKNVSIEGLMQFVLGIHEDTR